MATSQTVTTDTMSFDTTPTSTSAPTNPILDMICIGFGPASLAIAVALADRYPSTSSTSTTPNTKTNTSTTPTQPTTLYLEKERTFAWHAGMLIPGAKMQISFIKDLASARDPSSRFTFLNYLHEHGRLRAFAKLNTFLPARAEFADYMKWVAGFFEERVRYGVEVVSVRPVWKGGKRKVRCFEVQARICETGELVAYFARHVVIGVGGKPNIPSPFRQQTNIIHSSQYLTHTPTLLPSPSHPYNISILGSGQSAAEIFSDLSTRYPHAHLSLIFRDSALRPSDDSPFVNEIFDPDRIDTFYVKPSETRKSEVRRDKATNYSVVRIELIEKIYASLIRDDIATRTGKNVSGSRQILNLTEIDGLSPSTNSNSNSITLNLRKVNTTQTSTHPCNLLILATGYTRKSHIEILRPCEELMPMSSQISGEERSWSVRRDYSVMLDGDVEDVGIWLQGCCEETHGLSDGLLSVLANRGGELVESIFGR